MKTFLSTAIVIFAFLFANIDNQDIIWLDENLRKTSQSQATYYKVGNKLEGEVTYYYKNRNIYRKTTYAKGKIEGRFYEYYDTGELREVGVYENGLREGNWKVFYKSGKIKQKGKYSRGEKVGIWKTYYKNEN